MADEKKVTEAVSSEPKPILEVNHLRKAFPIKKSLTGEDIDMLHESRQRGLGSQSMSYKDDIDGA